MSVTSVTPGVHVGTPADDFNFTSGESVTIHFHDFLNLTAHQVDSPTFNLLGCEWCLELYPNGSAHDTNGWVSVHLRRSRWDIKAKCEVSLMKSSGITYTTKDEAHHDINAVPLLWGCRFFVERDSILDESNGILNEGTLTLVVRIVPDEDYPDQDYSRESNPPKFSSEIGPNIFKLFGDEDTADVAFKVNSTMFYAHKLVLMVQAPDLFELVEGFHKDTPMAISDVEHDTFEIMMKSVYGKLILPSEWEKHSKEILKASGKYGFAKLSSDAEVWYIKTMNLTVETAIDELLYADANHCLELKKAVIEFIVKNGKAVMESSSFPELFKSQELLSEVMSALVCKLDGLKRHYTSVRW